MRMEIYRNQKSEPTAVALRDKLALNILNQRNLLGGNHPCYNMAIVPTTALYDCD